MDDQENCVSGTENGMHRGMQQHGTFEELYVIWYG